MDSFFASCEELKDPSLKGKPFVVTTAGGKERGVVQTASYSARKFGIHSAMSTMNALKLKSDLVCLPSDERFYETTSERIIGLLGEYKLKMEAMSIDEVAIDSGIEDYGKAVWLAEEMRQKIRNEIGLTCTIGVSISTIYAKMACDAFKPDKVGLVKREDLANFLSDKDVIEIIGVGEKTKERLNKMGIYKISDLAKANNVKLLEQFGKLGIYLVKIARGEDDTGVANRSDIVSIGRETTLQSDSKDMEVIVPILEKITKETIDELNKKNLWYRSVSGKVRYSDFSIRTKTKRLSNYTDSYDAALNTTVELIKALVGVSTARKVGIRLSEFSKKGGQSKL